jgi:hypothetical protein
VRKGDDNDAIWRDTGVSAFKVNISKLALWMPVMTPSITADEKLLSFMDTGGKSLISWLAATIDTMNASVNGVFTWHQASKQSVAAPHHVFVVLQDKTRVFLQERSHMNFDQLGLSDVSLWIKGQQEPSDDILLNYDQNQIARAYHHLLTFMGRDNNVDTVCKYQSWILINYIRFITFQRNILT